MSAEQISLRLMLILSALSGAGWCAVRALGLELGAHGTLHAAHGAGKLAWFGLGGLALCVLAVFLLMTLRRSLSTPQEMPPRNQ